ncbi:MAG: hypothetical protein V1872_04550 [bacterium]
MSLLIRKIDKRKWLQTDICNGEDISADAITNCIKTKGNKLSVWESKTEADIEDSILAIVSSHQHLETIDVVLMNSDYLGKRGVDFIASPGLTPIEELKDTHIDLANLSYKKLGTVAYHIAERIKDDSIKRYTKGSLKEILKRAIDQKKLKIDDLDENLKKGIFN